MSAERTAPPCKVRTALAALSPSDRDTLGLLLADPQKNGVQIAEAFAAAGQDVHLKRVQMHRKGSCSCTEGDRTVSRAAAAQAAQEAPAGWQACARWDGDHGTVTTPPREGPVTDWPALLLEWGFDPEQFEVEHDAITFNTWDGFAKIDVTDDDGKTVQQLTTRRLYSYRARIRRRNPFAVPEQRQAEWRAALLKDRPRPRTKPAAGGTYALFVADPQLGKQGTEEAVENWKGGVIRHLEQAAAINADRIVVGFMGDETENVIGNYASQTYTVELNRSEQLLLDFDLRMWTLRQALSVGGVTAASVRSNHGEWTRDRGKEPITNKADNASTFIAEMCKRQCDAVGVDVDWVIANDGPHAVLDVDGVKLYMSHFYEQKGRASGSNKIDKTRSAIERQIIGRTDELGDVGIYVTAHFHHFYSQTWEGRSQFGCPALEAERSSGYMLNAYGVWSPPGMLGMRVGEKFGPLGWRDAAVL